VVLTRKALYLLVALCSGALAYAVGRTPSGRSQLESFVGKQETYSVADLVIDMLGLILVLFVLIKAT